MPFEIRNLTLDDMEEAVKLDAHAFGMDLRHDVTPMLENVRGRFSTCSYLGAFEDGEMTSMMCIVPVEMYLNGGSHKLGAVSPVANSPLHRRKGHTGAMLRRSLEQMREAGQALSGLYTPHPAFYRRYGWEVASEWRSLTFKPKDFSLTAEPSQRGRFRFIGREDWLTLAPIYQRFAAAANGPFDRSETWWRTYVTEVPWQRGTDIVVWSNEDGVDEGYGIYQQPNTPGLEFPTAVVLVRELVANTPDAYLNLLAFFGRHDIHHEVTIHLAPHNPVLTVFADSEKLNGKAGPAVLLRIVDFEAAMTQRLPASRDEEAEVILQLTDESAPWNDGTWRVSIAGGATSAERTDAAPELTLSTRALAPIYNGYVSPRAAVATGLLHAESDEAIDRASRVFGVTQPPYFTDHF